MNYLLCSGWAHNNDIFEFLDIPGKIYLSWEKSLENHNIIIEKLSKINNCVLIGWSLGAFILYPLLKHKNVKAAIFFSGSLSFTQHPLNIYGINRKAVLLMSKKFKKNPINILEQFYKNSGSLNVPKMFNKKLFSDGLDLLSSVNNTPIETTKPILQFHGKLDQIIDYKSSLAITKYNNTKTILLPKAQHNLFSEHKQIIQTNIKQFIGSINEYFTK